MYIYLITNMINGKQYIGQTKRTIEKRFKGHCNKSIKNCTSLISLAIRKYGKDKFKLEQLAIATSINELNELERRFIEEYNTMEPSGYNLKTGGSNQCNYSDSVKVRMRKAKLGTKLSEETKKKMSIAHKSFFANPINKDKNDKFINGARTQEHYNKTSIRMKEYWEDNKNRENASIRAKECATDEWKLEISIAVKNGQTHMSEDSKKRLQESRDRHKRKIIDSNGIVYESLKEASDKTGCFASSIIKNIKGINKTANGLTFRYLNDIKLEKPIMYIIAGSPGSGKSWVCNQLTNCNYISYDIVKNKDLSEIFQNNLTPSIPTIFDPTCNITTFIKRCCDIFDVKPIFIIEDINILKSRIANRSGKWSEYLTKRIKQIASRSKKYGIFSGTSDEVLEYMKNELKMP